MEAEDEFIHLVWGEYGMRVGRFVFFGDPNVLQCICEVIFDCEARGKNCKILSD